jgi:opacity protein-like surface antigen
LLAAAVSAAAASAAAAAAAAVCEQIALSYEQHWQHLGTAASK